MSKTDNLKKHTSKNFLQVRLIKNFYNTLLGMVADLGVQKVLDVGCGEGFTLSELTRNNVGKILEGIDSSAEAISAGKVLMPDMNLREGDVYHLPYEDNSFDLVICTEVLEHLENPERALNEIIRVSKKYCLFSVPNEPIFRLANFLRGKNISRWGNDIEHINHWGSDEFASFIGSKSKILAKKTPFPWTMILTQKNNS